MAELLADGTRNITLAKEQYAEIQTVLQRFFQRTKCGTVLFTDLSGLVIAQHGSLNTTVMVPLGALAAANYAATTEMARLIGEESGFKVHFHEGEKENIFVSGVGEDYCLVIVFGESTTFGMVRIQTLKAAEELLGIVSAVVEEPKVTDTLRLKQDDIDFREELSSRLDEVLSVNKTSK